MPLVRKLIRDNRDGPEVLMDTIHKEVDAFVRRDFPPTLQKMKEKLSKLQQELRDIEKQMPSHLPMLAAKAQMSQQPANPLDEVDPRDYGLRGFEFGSELEEEEEALMQLGLGTKKKKKAPLKKMTVKELKVLLRERGLPVSGLKAELIERLANEY